ncbi:Transposase (or an inactivated derivative) [Blastococcus mobilis]|uniref:Mutator family transposase n=1 Tax=Blastococcus mobilis TaxID=1938746 RepID=A0A239AQK3_9ACTN|nr:IS256 family transposase [Blastococcus mobilis]SNR97820.1 Transposase (or an inactivated derivative) [Blastococcus mobilis]
MTDTTNAPVVDDGAVPAEKPRGRVGRPRRDADQRRLVPEDFARQLVVQAREEGLDIAGDSGLLQQMMKSVLEAALAEELTDHLGYEHGDPAGRGSGNSRNGSTPKTLLTEAGPVELATPRDRAGTFEPQIVRKGQRRLDGIDKVVLGLYAKGMSTRDITAHLAEIYDVDVSPDLISKITDAVHAEVAEWQARPLNTVYPVIFLDALVCKVRDGGSVRNKAAHLAVGVDADGRKEVLGIWVETTEGAKFWLRVMNELKARGVQDVLIAVCDGLSGLPEAINAVWPQTVVQTCIVHLVRASLRWVNYKDRKKVAALLRTVYSAPTEAAARAELDALADSEFGRDNPAVIRRWRDSWERVIPLFDFAPEVRKVIYTTNMIESINSQLRRATRNRGHFPSDDALVKVLYLACKEMGRTTTRATAGRGGGAWKTALNQFDIMFPGRLDLA